MRSSRTSSPTNQDDRIDPRPLHRPPVADPGGDEHELARRAAGGDREAFGALVRRHRAAARRVAAAVCGDGGAADDIVQVATERAWAAFAGFDPDRNVRAWLLAIVANTARNHRRSWWRRRHAELRLVAQRQPASTDPADAAITDAERRIVLAALNRLEPDDRLVLALRHFDQLSEREMAEVLDCPAGTVKSRLSRAGARLRAELRESPPGHDGRPGGGEPNGRGPRR